MHSAYFLPQSAQKNVKSKSVWDNWVHILLSPPGKMDLRRAFLFFSSGAIGSGLELSTEEGSRELLFILKGGAGGFSSISTLSDIFSCTHYGLQRQKERAFVKSVFQICDH